MLFKKSKTMQASPATEAQPEPRGKINVNRRGFLSGSAAMASAPLLLDSLTAEAQTQAPATDPRALVPVTLKVNGHAPNRSHEGRHETRHWRVTCNLLDR